MRKLNHNHSAIVTSLFALGIVFSAAIEKLKPGSGTAYAGDPVSLYSKIESACGPSESWAYGQTVSKATLARIKAVGRGKGNAIEAMTVGYGIKMSERLPEVRALGEYIIYRSFYDLGLVHFAHRGFAALVASPAYPPMDGVRIGALGCLNRIHHAYPSMEYPMSTSTSLTSLDIQRLSQDQRVAVWEAASTIASRKLSASGRNADLGPEFQLLRGSGPYELFVRTNDAAARDSDAQVIAYGERLAATPGLPESIRSQLDAIHLNIARVYYQQGQWDKSIAQFKRVKNDSNLFSQAVSDLSWTYLMKPKYSEATGTAFNLMAGDLKKTFSPDGPMVAAIAYFETCHYPEAMQSLQYFRKNYDKSYRWLYSWYNQQRTQPTDLYQTVISYLKTKTGVPPHIASEWIRSPVFINEQQEMNLLFDEQQTSKDLMAELGKGAKTNDPSRNVRQSLRGVLADFSSHIPDTQRGLIGRINGELSFRNRYMIAHWVEAFENSQLIEVEIYNSAGEDMIKKNIIADAGDPKGMKRPVPAKKDSDGLPVLDWGRFPANDQEDTETWQDEVGFLRTDVTNNCPPTRH